MKQGHLKVAWYSAPSEHHELFPAIQEGLSHFRIAFALIIYIEISVLKSDERKLFRLDLLPDRLRSAAVGNSLHLGAALGKIRRPFKRQDSLVHPVHVQQRWRILCHFADSDINFTRRISCCTVASLSSVIALRKARRSVQQTLY